MGKGILVVLALLLIGCTYEGTELKEYFKHPRTLIKDPLFVEYKEKRDVLESSYLRKEITYADYVKGMEDLDEIYDKEVQERESKIINSRE